MKAISCLENFSRGKSLGNFPRGDETTEERKLIENGKKRVKEKDRERS
jgi:hypothetical protein